MKRSILTSLKYWLPLIVFSGIIIYLSGVPNSSLPKIPFSDKIAHLAEYLLWGFLAVLALSKTFSFSNQKIIVIAIVLGTLFGLSDECHQLFVNGRQFSYFDLLADFLGLLIGSVFIYERNLSV